jgi:hypothetical protein
MKPKSESTNRVSRSDNGSPVHPLINYSYHPAAGALSANNARSYQGAKRRLLAPDFRKISDEFFGAETTRDYVLEFLFFAVITGVSAWPIVSMLQALEQLFR